MEDVRLEIFEPPRFFEAFLQGRHFTETPDIVARICGICPVAYQMSAVHALENALGVKVSGALRDMRRLLYCGEWIESHVLHIYMLHAPDFLGYESAIDMAKDHRAVVERGLQMKKAGNELLRVLGGREIHPINVRVGGFYKAPPRRELAALLDSMKWARDAAIETVRWAAGLDFPDFDRDYEFVALHHGDEYPMNEGRIVSSAGLDIDVGDYEAHFEERHVPHSTALHSAIRERGSYFTGPMARFNLNHALLAPAARDLAREVGLVAPCRNPFKSILVRAIEVLHAFDEAVRLIESYEPPATPAVEITPGAGTGCGCTEAPRGILFHRYRLDEAGLIAEARIVPPTSQNQAMIEEDLRDLVERNIEMADQELQHKCEQSIRNYDPCISCATHFLKLDVQRR
ncbi:MAG TPA: Ni/Fe hydrogenase subunit alpha [Burkholderiales bacterium]|nr:Ni/Fe hydrogenase subunit alpha [Burkholderiales bacterium]